MNETSGDGAVEVRLPMDIAGRIEKIAADLGVAPAEVVRSAILKGLSRLDGAGSGGEEAQRPSSGSYASV